MTFVFEFSETDTEKLCQMLQDCEGVVYYADLVQAFFGQLRKQQEPGKKSNETTGGLVVSLTEWQSRAIANAFSPRMAAESLLNGVGALVAQPDPHSGTMKIVFLRRKAAQGIRAIIQAELKG